MAMHGGAGYRGASHGGADHRGAGHRGAGYIGAGHRGGACYGGAGQKSGGLHPNLLVLRLVDFHTISLYDLEKKVTICIFSSD